MINHSVKPQALNLRDNFVLSAFFFLLLVGCFVGFYFGFVVVVLNIGKKSVRILCLVCFIVTDSCEVPGQKVYSC